MVLVAAILPNVFWLGHWSVPGLRVTAEAQAAHEHASHCHGNPSCADQAGYGLQWWSEGQDTLVFDSEPQRHQAAAPAPFPAQPALPRLDPPPRYA